MRSGSTRSRRRASTRRALRVLTRTTPSRAPRAPSPTTCQARWSPTSFPSFWCRRPCPIWASTPMATSLIARRRRRPFSRLTASSCQRRSHLVRRKPHLSLLRHLRLSRRFLSLRHSQPLRSRLSLLRHLRLSRRFLSLRHSQPLRSRLNSAFRRPWPQPQSPCPCPSGTSATRSSGS